jgi:hypothetical protein
MKLKKLFESQSIVFEQLIYVHHKELDLTSDEMMVIFGLLDIYKKRNSFSLSALQKRITIVQKDLGAIIDALITKTYLHTYLDDQAESKAKELFHLDGLFSKLEHLIDTKELIKSKPNDEGLKKVIVLLEQKLNRLLTSTELQTLRLLIETHQVTLESLSDIIEQLNDRVSLKNIEKMIMITKNMPKVVVDEKVDQALDNLYKAMK